MTSSRLLVAGVMTALALAACSASSNAERKLLTSQQDLCAGAVPDHGDDVVTMISCPWAQQNDNIAR